MSGSLIVPRAARTRTRDYAHTHVARQYRLIFYRAYIAGWRASRRTHVRSETEAVA